MKKLTLYFAAQILKLLMKIGDSTGMIDFSQKVLKNLSIYSENNQSIDKENPHLKKSCFVGKGKLPTSDQILLSEAATETIVLSFVT